MQQLSAWQRAGRRRPSAAGGIDEVEAAPVRKRRGDRLVRGDRVAGTPDRLDAIFAPRR
jgi:hypothetical protein